MTQTIGYNSASCFLRPAQPEDEQFLFRLFAESQEHLAAFRSNAELYASLMEMQYRGRKQSYSAQFPHAVDAILCLQDEARGALPVGRILVDCQPERWRVVDMAVLAAHRGRGLGSWALRLCQRQCEAAGAKLVLGVRPENRARRLYERLGLRVTEESALTVEMESVAPFPEASESLYGGGLRPVKRTMIPNANHNASIKIKISQLHSPAAPVWSGTANQP
ncbi:MAG: GNAT family N-acetyltransferase [Terracidiphilus sp.]